MPENQEDKVDILSKFLGGALGYGLFAGFLVLYDKLVIGHLDSDDFAIRMITPFSLRLRWTDFVCYGLIGVGIALIAKLRNQL